MHAASINPSDLVFMRGSYGFAPREGVIPGLEGSGEIIACGKGLAPRLFLGRRVACTPLVGEDGTFASHMITSVGNLVPLLPSLSYEEGASLIVNPLSAWLLLSKVRELNSHTILVTVSTGALGTMLVRLGKSLGYTIIGVVQKNEHVQGVKSAGASEVLVKNDPGFLNNLREMCHRYQTRVALDGAAGETTSLVVKAMPKGSTIILYGSLGGNAMELDASDFIFSDISLVGFWLYHFTRSASRMNMAKTFYTVQKKVKKELATPVFATYPLHSINEAIACYLENRTQGKVILTME
ncbi:zinc-binding dehydrogenase [Myxococcota bacterium]|nr:zinc-binding dehydrogenase [Myxococcota bacterium]